MNAVIRSEKRGRSLYDNIGPIGLYGILNNKANRGEHVRRYKRQEFKTIHKSFGSN